MKNADAVRFVLAVADGTRIQNGYFCCHRSLTRRLGSDASRMLVEARSAGLVTSSGRGRNRAHRLTIDGMRLANNKGVTAGTLHGEQVKGGDSDAGQ